MFQPLIDVPEERRALCQSPFYAPAFDSAGYPIFDYRNEDSLLLQFGILTDARVTERERAEETAKRPYTEISIVETTDSTRMETDTLPSSSPVLQREEGYMKVIKVEDEEMKTYPPPNP